MAARRNCNWLRRKAALWRPDLILPHPRPPSFRDIDRAVGLLVVFEHGWVAVTEALRRHGQEREILFDLQGSELLIRRKIP